jgi:hypothetical protein
MAPEDMKKIALIIKTRLYEWTVMMFGHKNVTNTFTMTMLEVFKELGDKFLIVFVDDFNVHNKSWEEHLQHLDVVFLKLKEVNLKLKLSKSCFVTKSDAPLSSLCDPKGVQRVGFAEMVRNLVPLPASSTKRGKGVVLEAPGLD